MSKGTACPTKGQERRACQSHTNQPSLPYEPYSRPRRPQSSRPTKGNHPFQEQRYRSTKRRISPSPHARPVSLTRPSLPLHQLYRPPYQSKANKARFLQLQPQYDYRQPNTKSRIWGGPTLRLPRGQSGRRPQYNPRPPTLTRNHRQEASTKGEVYNTRPMSRDKVCP